MRIHAALPGKDLIKQKFIIPKPQNNLSVNYLGDFWIQSYVVEFHFHQKPISRYGFS
jgi:hypothetical protein